MTSESVQNGENREVLLDFNKILSEIGESGPYQIIVSISSGLISTYGSFLIINFVFMSAIPDHRCWIPECESADSSDFNPAWMKNAIPHQNDKFDTCSRYQFDDILGSCVANRFNQSSVTQCDRFIIKDNEQTLATHLNMLCTDQERKLDFLGTATTLGRFLATPVSGIISDKYGRLITMVIGAILGAIFSSLQALPASLMTFELYWVFEFLASLLSTGMIEACFIYNMEWVTANYRIRSTTIFMLMDIVVAYLGIGFAAWYFADNFIRFKLAMSIPGFFAIFLYFFLGESPQWLLSKNKYSQAIKSLSKAGKIIGKPLQPHTIKQIEKASTLAGKQIDETDTQSNIVTIRDLLREKVLVFRLVIVSLVWMIGFFAYYGVLYGSTKVHGNKYVSFIVVGLADLPGTALNAFLMDRVGRKWTIAPTLFIYGLLLLVYTQVSMGGIYQLLLFFISKMSLTAAVIGLYPYTSELWPTSIRNTLYSISSMSGRVGSIIAALTLSLSDYYAHLPPIMYASSAIVGAILLYVFLPETVYCEKAPDTIEDALAIGKKKEKAVIP